jgi:hypothetical protein
MDPNFTLNNLLSGAMFDANGRDSLNITAGTLQVQNGATATVTSGSALPTIGTLYVTNGTLSLQSGASAITVQNTLELDGNASLQSADPNNTIIIQPALDSNTASNVVITTQDGNALSGLGNLTLVCQFDPNNTQAETINLEVAGAPYDPNLVVGGVDNNFSAANFVINTLVVGRQDGDPNKHGTTLNLVNNFHDANHIAVYVRNLVMAPGGKIQLNNGFKLYYLVGNPTDGNTAKQFFPGDGNLDGKVDGVDFLLWQSNYNQNPGTNKWSTADFNGDRIVDGVDFLIWQSNYPKSGLDAVGIGPAASLANPYSPARSQIDTNGDGVISIEEAQKAFDGLDMNR